MFGERVTTQSWLEAPTIGVSVLEDSRCKPLTRPRFVLTDAACCHASYSYWYLSAHKPCVCRLCSVVALRWLGDAAGEAPMRAASGIREGGQRGWQGGKGEAGA